MTLLLRIVVIGSFFLAAILAATIPKDMSKSPYTKSLRTKGSNRPKNRERYDSSVSDYMSERICGFNEMCKEEFSVKFRCRCPYWSFCSSPGRYYNAYCVMSGAGYLWTQPQGFFNGGGASSSSGLKTTRYKKKFHKAKPDKVFLHSLSSNML